MRYKIIIGLTIVMVLFIIPFLSADCPSGFICGGTEIEVAIREYWIDYTDLDNPITSSTLELGACYKPGAMGEEFCCPIGSECEPTGESGPGGEIYNCVYTNKDFCWKLKDEESSNEDNEKACNEYTKWIAINDIESHKGEGYCGVDDNWWPSGDNICWYETECGCEWDGDNENCVSIDNRITVCNDTFTPSVQGVCTYTMDTWQDNCDVDGFIYASWTAIGTGNYAEGGADENECQNTDIITIPCEKIVKLDFFTWFNIIVVVLILILIYYSYIQVKKKK